MNQASRDARGTWSKPPPPEFKLLAADVVGGEEAQDATGGTGVDAAAAGVLLVVPLLTWR